MSLHRHFQSYVVCETFLTNQASPIQKFIYRQCLLKSIVSQEWNFIASDLTKPYNTRSFHRWRWVSQPASSVVYLWKSSALRIDLFNHCEKFISLAKVVLQLCLDVGKYDEDLLEVEGNLILSYINALFPKFECFANTQHKLEIHFKVT
jgi:hypothetical protein